MGKKGVRKLLSTDKQKNRWRITILGPGKNQRGKSKISVPPNGVIECELGRRKITAKPTKVKKKGKRAMMQEDKALTIDPKGRTVHPNKHDSAAGSRPERQRQK